MGTISVSLPTDGTTADVADVNTPITTIVNEFNGNIDNNNIKSGAAIDFSKISGGSATALVAWASWTPTWTGLTVGNGTLNYALYTQIGKNVKFRIKFTMGSTSSVTGQVFFSPPVTAAANQDVDFGSGYIDDAGVAGYPCLMNLASSTAITFIVSAASGTYTTRAAVNATTPFAIGNTDAFRGAGVYEAT